MPSLAQVLDQVFDMSSELERDTGEVNFTFPKEGSRGGNQNLKGDDHFNFKFSGVMDMLTQQETVFNMIAKDVTPCSKFGR